MPAGRQYGLGLPETLVALALLGITLSGLMSLQWRAHQLQQQAWQRQQVLLLIEDFLQRLHLNPQARNTYLDGLAEPLPATAAADACAVRACLPAARAVADLQHLANELRRLLPMPDWQREACLDAPGVCLLVAWAGTLPSSGPDGSCLDAAGQRRNEARCLAVELP